MCHLWAPQLHDFVLHWLAKRLTTGLAHLWAQTGAVEACWVSTSPFVTGSHVACIPPVYRPLPGECLLSPDLRLLQVLQITVVLPCLLRYKLHPVAEMKDGRLRLAPGSWYPHAPSLPSWDCPGTDSFCGGHMSESSFQLQMKLKWRKWRNILARFEFIHRFNFSIYSLLSDYKGFIKPYSWLKHLFTKHWESSIKGIYH